jgi:hypothetical protein
MRVESGRVVLFLSLRSTPAFFSLSAPAGCPYTRLSIEEPWTYNRIDCRRTAPLLTSASPHIQSPVAIRGRRFLQYQHRQAPLLSLDKSFGRLASNQTKPQDSFAKTGALQTFQFQYSYSALSCLAFPANNTSNKREPSSSSRRHSNSNSNSNLTAPVLRNKTHHRIGAFFSNR